MFEVIDAFYLILGMVIFLLGYTLMELYTVVHKLKKYQYKLFVSGQEKLTEKFDVYEVSIDPTNKILGNIAITIRDNFSLVIIPYKTFKQIAEWVEARIREMHQVGPIK